MEETNEKKESVNNTENNRERKTDNSFTGNKKPKFNAVWLYVLIGMTLVSIYLFDSGQQPPEIDWYFFKNELLLKGEVQKVVVVNNKDVEIYIKPEYLNQPKHQKLTSKGLNALSRTGPHYKLQGMLSLEKFEERLEEAQEDVSEENKIYAVSRDKQSFGQVIWYLLPVIALVILYIVIFRRMSGGGPGAGGTNIFNVGKSKAKIFDKDTNVKIDFKDVAGLEEAKIEIKEIVDFLKKPKKYTDLGGKIPKGALLVGPPGTGKTLLARAVAGEAHVPFFSLSGSDFVEMFVGVGASRVRDLFKTAKEKAPCIVFIDEIDAIGRARGRNPNFGANDERENTLNQLLTEMDGFASNAGVIILAATNRADILDKALLRAGRFDRQIYVELPDLTERREIFLVHLRPIKIEKSLDIDFLARQTPGFSGADIANVCNEAALIAARKSKKAVQKQDFLDAIDRIVGGLEKKNKIISPDEKRTIAFHEGGHATVSWLLEHANPMVKVTIIPRGKSLGAAWYLPEERQITTREQLLDEMCATLGGRASEQTIFKKISTGAVNDLEKVTKQAYAMVIYFGLSDKVGNISFYDSTGQSEYSFHKPYSEKTSEMIDHEVKEIVTQQYERALRILEEHKEGLTKLSEQLLEKEVIFAEDLEKIFGKRKGDKTPDVGKKQKKSRKTAKSLKAKSETGNTNDKAESIKKSA
ncbi:MAG: ATP-dependent zinc metalloprotease FtsH [Bacteroidales bacterium]|nr:ATP-dependent zinc metalloprotease FtsH [Bacteroidales bacterium]MBN2763978.1 ATP-dependent zinc metalloprotease FtsH [Bacteroidales bacterium]